MLQILEKLVWGVEFELRGDELWVRGTPEGLDQAEALLQNFVGPRRAVLFQARLVSITESGCQALGLKVGMRQPVYDCGLESWPVGVPRMWREMAGPRSSPDARYPSDGANRPKYDIPGLHLQRLGADRDSAEATLTRLIQSRDAVVISSPLIGVRVGDVSLFHLRERVGNNPGFESGWTVYVNLEEVSEQSVRFTSSVRADQTERLGDVLYQTSMDCKQTLDVPLGALLFALLPLTPEGTSYVREQGSVLWYLKPLVEPDHRTIVLFIHCQRLEP